MEELTVQKYADGSTVLVNGHEWTVQDMSRDSEGLLPSQTDRGEDYNLYRLSRHNAKPILRWQYELDLEQPRTPQSGPCAKDCGSKVCEMYGCMLDRDRRPTDAQTEYEQVSSINDEYCWTHDRPKNGGWTCPVCRAEE